LGTTRKVKKKREKNITKKTYLLYHAKVRCVCIEVAGELIVFKAVSPNGDGKNEFLVLPYIESISSKNQVSIYNQWGDEVFSISDYDNKTRVFAGLGTSGSKLPSGTYFYKIALSNVSKTLTGFVDLRN
jgi:gliding motility-associated-like protein